MRFARFKPFATPLAPPASTSPRLLAFDGFGPNPGALGAWLFTPRDAPAPVPLVVVLHGCTQTAHGYDIGSGWSALAEAHGFAVLFPEQRRSNNPSLCFNWFEPADTRRGGGEAASIVQMVEALVAGHGIDRARVFVTGLSAGGAMTSALLALYPEVFAGGAILAGLPHGAAAGAAEAFQQMRAPTASARTAGGAIRHAAPGRDRWPTVSIWHGTADAVVHPSNADAILRQWLEVHGLPANPSETNLVDGHPHRAWRDADGRLLLEDYRVAGMGHGTPLATHGECGCGEAGAFMLEAGISSTLHSARAWGLLAAAPAAQPEPPSAPAPELAPEPAPEPMFEPVTENLPALRRPKLERLPDPPPPPPPADNSPIGRIIENALRSAGLMK